MQVLNAQLSGISSGNIADLIMLARKRSKQQRRWRQPEEPCGPDLLILEETPEAEEKQSKKAAKLAKKEEKKAKKEAKKAEKEAKKAEKEAKKAAKAAAKEAPAEMLMILKKKKKQAEGEADA